MKTRKSSVLAFLSFSVAGVALLCTAPLLAQEHHHHGDGELGTVNFPVSCAPEVRVDFSHAVALLHSFGYEQARNAFTAIARKDPSCAMAQWGVAMTWYHPIWAPPTASDLDSGRAAAEKAATLPAESEREKGFVDAIGKFYRGGVERDFRSRTAAYRDAMTALAGRFPDDHEVVIFEALSILGAAVPGDPTFTAQKQAAGILTSLLDAEPNHPGIAHYMIHAYDYPPLASLALPAARRYAQIAPASPHALHMPTHIFTRLGLWKESIDGNLASSAAAQRIVAVAHPGTTSFDDLHAMDYLEYAYLQLGDDAKAHEVLDRAAKVSAIDAPELAAAYSLCAIPARYAVERRQWADAAKLEMPKANLPWDRFAYAGESIYLARAIGSARTGNASGAKEAVARLEALRDALRKSPVPGPYDWASHLEATRLSAAAWLARVEGRDADAVELARAGADLDDKIGKHAVSPGGIVPARELLGDLLLDLNRPAEALPEYEASLRNSPNRLNALAGAS
ncbi:MAG TPA: hypothetical protein VFL12_04560, partial [Thermoanaerobaculia bacterium]|nr:hypothetical protein [Thermoanaerobaculia bacterium]